MGIARVTVVEVAVAEPGHLARGDDALAEHDGLIVFPRNLVEQVLQVGVGGSGGEDNSVISGLSVVGENAERRLGSGAFESELKLVVHLFPLILIDGWILNFRNFEGFLAFDAGSAFPAVDFATFVAGPGVGEVDGEFGSSLCDVFFAEVDEGAEDGDVGVGAGGDGLGHGGEEVFATVGVDGVVAGVGSDDEAFGSDAFGVAGGDG